MLTRYRKVELGDIKEAGDKFVARGYDNLSDEDLDTARNIVYPGQIHENGDYDVFRPIRISVISKSIQHRLKKRWKK